MASCSHFIRLVLVYCHTKLIKRACCFSWLMMGGYFGSRFIIWTLVVDLGLYFNPLHNINAAFHFQGTNLDSNAKMWRLVADLMNDIGIIIGHIVPNYLFIILNFKLTCKCMVLLQEC